MVAGFTQDENAPVVPGSTLPPVKAKNYGSVMNDSVLSYHTIFEVLEESGPNPSTPEGEVLWGRRLRFRLYGTDYFLCMRPRDDLSQSLLAPKSVDEYDESDVEYQLGLTEVYDDPLTLFTCTPIKREGDEMTFGAETVLQSALLRQWVHCSDDLPYSKSKKGSLGTS